VADQQSLESIIIAQEAQLLAATQGKFYRISFEILRNGASQFIHTLTLNPEELDREDEINATVTNTLGGIFVDDFGLGIISYSMRGTTGFHPKRTEEGDIVDGYQEIKILRDKINLYFLEPTGSKRERLTDDYELIYHDWLMEEHYSVQPVTKFRLARSKQQAILYAYDFSFVVINAVTSGPQKTVAAQDPLAQYNAAKPRLQAAQNTMSIGADLLRIITSRLSKPGPQAQ
jgi:hypothetical protein